MDKSLNVFNYFINFSVYIWVTTKAYLLLFYHYVYLTFQYIPFIANLLNHSGKKINTNRKKTSLSKIQKHNPKTVTIVFVSLFFSVLMAETKEPRLLRSKL